MHGRKKTVRSEVENNALKEKAQTYATLVKIVMEKKQINDLSLETLPFLEKLIKNNPDFYSLWNMRRRVLIHTYNSLGLSIQRPSTKINEDGADIARQELNLSAEAIRKNPKSCKCY